MPAFRFLLAPALLALLPALGAHAQGDEDWDAQIQAQMDMAATTLAERGYTATGDRFDGAIDNGESEGFELRLPADSDFAVIGFCDVDCADLDLAALDGSGNEVQADYADDDVPFLELSTRGRGADRVFVRVDMVDCAAQPCFWGVAVYRLGAPSTASVPAIVPGGGWTRSGNLAPGDETLTTGEYLDVYDFYGQAGQQVRLQMSSSAIDTYLILVPPDGEQLENDDAPDVPGSSVIDTRLAATGTYRILATSYGQETGSYQLSYQPATAPSSMASVPQDVRIAIGETRNGTLAPGDLVLDGNEFADSYVFQGRAGQAISLSMVSSEFDTYLALQLPDGAILQNDDDQERPGGSRIELTLQQDGEYGILTTSYAAGELGRYVLSLDAVAPAPVASFPPATSTPTRTPTPTPVPAQPRLPDIGQPPTPSTGTGRVYAVLVGISDYPGEAGDLAYTAEDALRIQKALIDGAGMRPEDSVLLTDHQATTAGLNAAIAKLGSRMTPADLLVFFFSGHGDRVRRVGFQAADPDSLDETLVLYDGQVLDDQLAASFGNVRAGRVLLVLDSCFSGGFAKDVISAPNRMGLFSSQEDVTSQVAAKFRAGGYLSLFLADAIAGGYADDGDGQLTALELSQYIYERYRNDVKTGNPDDYVRTGGPRLGFQQLVVDRGSVGPYDSLFRLRRN